MNRKRTIIIASLAILAGILAFVVWAVYPVLKPVPVLPSTKILDRNGELLYEVARQDGGIRTAVKLDKMPTSLTKAVIAAEDQRFYQHSGIDWLGTARAIKDLVVQRRVVSGGSTLDQQLIKNLYFPDRSRSVIQKIREMLAARYWNLGHDKNQTLETYLNAVPFGNQTFGVQAAAQKYFHKDVSDLSLAESALLAGMVNAPTANDPYRHWSTARTRQRYVLNRMLEAGAINLADRDAAIDTDVHIFPPHHDIKAPHFVFKVLDELEIKYPDIRNGGYVVKTTLDPDLQQTITQSMNRRLARLHDQHVTDGAAVALNPQTGEILAYVGSDSYFNEDIQGQVDMASAKRQPGSALKPFMYFTSFMRGFSPSTIVADLPVRFVSADGQPYYPQNYGYKFSGPVSIRNALGSSLNVPAVKVLDKIGLETFMGSLARFGLTFPEPAQYYGLGVVLGGGEVTLMDTTRAYGSLALYGQSVEPIDVLEIKNSNGSVIQSATKQVHKPLFEDSKLASQAAYLVTDVLTDKQARAGSFGESNMLDIGKRIAAKTGTTKDFRDNWAFGYTPDFVLGIWVGNADNSPMQGVTGITGAVPIWNDVMHSRFDRADDIVWPQVPDIVQRTVCATSGLLANGICPKTRIEKFISGNEPTSQDNWYVSMQVDSKTGLATTVKCPVTANKITKVFLNPPAEYSAWLTSMNIEQVPEMDCEGHVLQNQGPLTIISPLDGDIFERDANVGPSVMSIPFVAGGKRHGTFVWSLNGQSLTGDGPVYSWEPKPGTYTLSLQGADRQITFSVR